jgi:small ubiquitin-related modifier
MYIQICVYIFICIHTNIQKIMDAFAGRKGITATSLRFTVDGERIAPDQTPKMLELEENDQIDVMLEMVRTY